MEAPAELLPWDSEFFGHRIARVAGGRLDAARLESIEAWSRQQNVDCLYFLADSEDAGTAAQAEGAGFHLVDLRITLQGELGRQRARTERNCLSDSEFMSTARSRCRPSSPHDIPRLRQIAATSHTDSRFYADPHFPPERCADLYALWIEKSCQGELADRTWVALHEGQAAGYITGALETAGGETLGEIGLLAVAPEAQGAGLGRALIDEAFAWFEEKGATRARVVTQGRNIRAQRLYQSRGLFTRSIGLWFHRWRTSGDA